MRPLWALFAIRENYTAAVVTRGADSLLDSVSSEYTVVKINQYTAVLDCSNILAERSYYCFQVNSRLMLLDQ